MMMMMLLVTLFDIVSAVLCQLIQQLRSQVSHLQLELRKKDARITELENTLKANNVLLRI